eukprot:gnl/Spiro4/615_TR350_c0_g1_i1.p1 gnl/Spiro4/615_TR350_c0_g1~~gnl/Spiro4/615_TR350_c0_g1_i1.p1  ORF type:complete len:294 (-),score=69.43 gnl/Spiro4/615_TR350_c0_g1_i1:176-985(-)
MDHGVDFSNPWFLTWFTLVPVSYLLLAGAFRAHDLWSFSTRHGSRASDILAFEICALLCVLYLGVSGLIGYFSLFGVNDFARLSQNVFYGESQFVINHLMVPMMAYQAWNVVLCILNRDLRDPAMLLHHTMVAFLAYLGLGPFLHFHTIYFFGVAELSNVFLTFVEIFKYFPQFAKQYPSLNAWSRSLFGVSFLVLRLLVWPYYSVLFWRDALALLSGTFVDAHGVLVECRSAVVVFALMFANIFLTGLQFYWGITIVGYITGKKPEKP